MNPYQNTNNSNQSGENNQNQQNSFNNFSFKYEQMEIEKDMKSQFDDLSLLQGLIENSNTKKIQSNNINNNFTFNLNPSNNMMNQNSIKFNQNLNLQSQYLPNQSFSLHPFNYQRVNRQEKMINQAQKQKQNQKINQLMKQFDQDLQNLQNLEKFFENQQKNKSEKKTNNQILNSDRTKKTVSRLSQRMTENSFNVDKVQKKKNHRQSRRLSGNLLLEPNDFNRRKSFSRQSFLIEKKKQKFEISVNPDNLQNELEQNKKETYILPKDNVSNLNLEKNQNRNNIFSLMNKNKSRTTLSMNEIINMLQTTSNEGNQNKQLRKSLEKQGSQKKKQKKELVNVSQQPKQHKEKQFFGIKIKNQQKGNVIYEDEREDQFTPFKRMNRPEPNEGNEIKIIEDPQKSIKNQMQEAILKYYFQNVYEQISLEKQKSLQLKNKAIQILEESNNLDKSFRPYQDQLLEAINQEKLYLQRVNESTKRIDQKSYCDFINIISQIEETLGIVIHTYVKYLQSENEDNQISQKMTSTGFFAEFSMSNFIFRLKRLSGDEPTNVKVFAYYQTQMETDRLKFNQQSKKHLFMNYLNKKSIHCDNFLQMAIQIVNYNKILNQFENTLEYLSIVYNLIQVQLTPKLQKISFRMLISQKYFSYFFTVELTELLEQNGGINIFSQLQNKVVEIPPQFLYSSPGSNSGCNLLQNSVNYLIDSVFNKLQESLLEKSH